MGETMLNSFKYQLLGAQELYQTNSGSIKRQCPVVAHVDVDVDTNTNQIPTFTFWGK